MLLDNSPIFGVRGVLKISWYNPELFIPMQRCKFFVLFSIFYWKYTYISDTTRTRRHISRQVCMEKRLMTIWIIDCPSYCQYEGIHEKTKSEWGPCRKKTREFFWKLPKLGQVAYLIDKFKCCPLIRISFVYKRQFSYGTSSWVRLVRFLA